MQKLIWLMNKDSDDIINLFSRYIYDFFKLRNDFKMTIITNVLLNHQKFIHFNIRPKTV